MGPFVWKPNFYIILVAPPGIATKSTAFGFASSLLYNVEGITPGPDSTTWQALAEYMANNTYMQTIGNDYEPMASVALAVSELGSFLKLDNQEMVDVLTDLWDGRDSGRPWRYTTRHSGEIVIPQPFVHFIGGTTPAWVAESFKEHTVGGGFASRAIFVYANKKEKLVALPYKHMNDVDHAKKELLQKDLAHIAQLCGEFKLSSEAEALAEEYYEEIWVNPGEELSHENLQGYRARKQAHSMKIAMVMSAARSDDLVIDAGDLRAAWSLLKDAEQHMTKVFTAIAPGTDLAKHEAQVMAKLEEYSSGVNQADFYRNNLSTRMGYGEFDRAVSALVASGRIKRRQDGMSFVIEAVR
jgi:hypothetical protein